MGKIHDQTFHNFKASKSVDRRILRSFESDFDASELLNVWSDWGQVQIQNLYYNEKPIFSF